MIDNAINDDKTIVGGEDMILAGRYHILCRLGQGGVGAVWLAEDRQPDDFKMAIKMQWSSIVHMEFHKSVWTYSCQNPTAKARII